MPISKPGSRAGRGLKHAQQQYWCGAYIFPGVRQPVPHPTLGSMRFTFFSFLFFFCYIIYLKASVLIRAPCGPQFGITCDSTCNTIVRRGQYNGCALVFMFGIVTRARGSTHHQENTRHSRGRRGQWHGVMYATAESTVH